MMGVYYALTEQRIPYMRDKTLDDRFFILTLFAVAMEAEKQMLNAKDTLLQAALPVGLPRSITARCTGSSRIILRTGASSGLPTRAFPIRLRLWKLQLSAGLCGCHDCLSENSGI